jgi:hypothetical protein
MIAKFDFDVYDLALFIWSNVYRQRFSRPSLSNLTINSRIISLLKYALLNMYLEEVNSLELQCIYLKNTVSIAFEDVITVRDYVGIFFSFDLNRI